MSLAQGFLDSLVLLSEVDEKPEYIGKDYGVEFTENDDGSISGSFSIPGELKPVKVNGAMYYQYVAEDFTVDPDAPVPDSSVVDNSADSTSATSTVDVSVPPATVPDSSVVDNSADSTSATSTAKAATV
jgi:hypothetical protein